MPVLAQSNVKTESNLRGQVARVLHDVRCRRLDHLRDEQIADQILAIPEIAEGLRRAWPGIYGEVASPTSDRNIISRAEWDALIEEHKRLQEQVVRYKLPTQRGACNRAKARVRELDVKIRAVDAVIGIDA